jgi:hypothetical protein
VLLALFEKDTKYVNGNMDLLRADPGLSGRSISGALPAGGAGENKLLQVNISKMNMMFGV